MEAVKADVRMEAYRDFGAYVEEKIGLAKQAAGVSNLAGFVIQAVRENYQDPQLQLKLEKRTQREQRAMLEALKSERDEKRSALLRQAVRTDPELLDQAAPRVQSRYALERIAE